MGTAREARTSTVWSVIVRAQGSGEEARAALDQLIRRYDGSVMAVIRRHPIPPGSTAEDLKQEFFAQILRRGDVNRLSPERGKFRGWLHRSVRNFVHNAWKSWNVPRRGNRDTSPLDFDVADAVTPDALYLRKFAEETVLHALERHRAETPNKARFDALKRFLPGPELDLDAHAPIARSLGMTPNALNVLLHRLKAEHKVILREAVADTLDLDPSDPGDQREIDDEMRRLYHFLTDVPAEPALERA